MRFTSLLSPVVGGMLSPLGAVIGSAVFVLLPNYLQAFQSYLGLVFALLLLGFIVLRPNGLSSTSVDPVSSRVGFERATGCQGHDRTIAPHSEASASALAAWSPLDSVTLNVAPASIQAVIGPNGAGKSTLLNVITGLYTRFGRNILFRDSRIDGCSPHDITRRGIARTFQNTGIIRRNDGDRKCHDRTRPLPRLWRDHGGVAGPTLPEHRSFRTNEARELLALVGLADDELEMAATLPFGKQRRLEIARALATRPDLLLLDEPAAGLRATEIDALESNSSRSARAAKHFNPRDRSRHASGDGDLGLDHRS